MFDWIIGKISEIFLEHTFGEFFWIGVRYFACPALVAFGVAKYKIDHADKVRRVTQRRSVIRFYKVLLESDMPILKNYLDETDGDPIPLPLAPLPIEVSLNDITMSHEENQFMADRLAQQLIFRSQFIGKSVNGLIDRKSVRDYYKFTEQSLRLIYAVEKERNNSPNSKHKPQSEKIPPT